MWALADPTAVRCQAGSGNSEASNRAQHCYPGQPRFVGTIYRVTIYTTTEIGGEKVKVRNWQGRAGISRAVGGARSSPGAQTRFQLVA